MKFFIGILFLALMSFPGMGKCSEPTSGIASSFEEGQRLFVEGDLSAAKESYRKFLSGYPQSRLIDDALFRLGEISLTQKDFPIALRYFNLLLNHFGNSELALKAELKRTICIYHAESKEKAAGLVDQFLKQAMDPRLRYEAFITQAGWRSEAGELGKAVVSYRKALSTLPIKKEEVKKLVQEALEKETDAETLLQLSQNAPTNFPYGDVMYRLLSLYFKARDFEGFTKSARDFLQRFPGHRESNSVKEVLDDFAENPHHYKTKVGALLPLTGNAALQGERILKGIQLALSSFQGPGGIEVVIKDSAGDLQTAAEAVKELAQDPSVIAIIGPAFSKVAEGVAPLVQSMRIPMLSPAASFMEILPDNSFFFRNCITWENLGREIAEYAVNELAVKRFAVLHPDDAYGVGLSENFRKSVTALGGELLATESYSTVEFDFRETIKKIGGIEDHDILKVSAPIEEGLEEEMVPDYGSDKLSFPFHIEDSEQNSKKPNKVLLKTSYEAIFIPDFFKRIGLMIPQLEFFNIVEAKLLGANGWNSEKLVGLLKNRPEDFYFVDGFFAGDDSAKTMDFVDQYDSFFGETPDILAAQAYDAAGILVNLYQSGKKDRESLRDGLADVRELQGVAGVTTILPSGDSEKKLFVLTVRDGELVKAGKIEDTEEE